MGGVPAQDEVCIETVLEAREACHARAGISKTSGLLQPGGSSSKCTRCKHECHGPTVSIWHFKSGHTAAVVRLQTC